VRKSWPKKHSEKPVNGGKLANFVLKSKTACPVSKEMARAWQSRPDSEPIKALKERLLSHTLSKTNKGQLRLRSVESAQVQSGTESEEDGMSSDESVSSARSQRSSRGGPSRRDQVGLSQDDNEDVPARPRSSSCPTYQRSSRGGSSPAPLPDDAVRPSCGRETEPIPDSPPPPPPSPTDVGELQTHSPMTDYRINTFRTTSMYAGNPAYLQSPAYIGATPTEHHVGSPEWKVVADSPEDRYRHDPYSPDSPWKLDVSSS